MLVGLVVAVMLLGEQDGSSMAFLDAVKGMAAASVYLDGDRHIVCGSSAKCLSSEKVVRASLVDVRKNLLQDMYVAAKKGNSEALFEAKAQALRWTLCVIRSAKSGTNVASANEANVCWLTEMVKPLPDHPDALPAILGTAHDLNP